MRLIPFGALALEYHRRPQRPPRPAKDRQDLWREDAGYVISLGSSPDVS